MSVNVLQPWVLVLLPLLLPIFFFLGRPRMARLPRWLRRSALGTRLAIVTLIVVALSQPLLGRTSESVSVVFALDRSESVSQEARQASDGFVGQAMQQLSETRRAGVVVFGRDAAVERPIGGSSAPGQVQIRPDGTNVAEALHLARSMLPRVGGKKIVLLSDGRETLSRAEDEARAAANQGVQISVVPLAGSQPPEVLVEALEIPSQIREGESLDAVIAVGATVETDATLKLWLDTKLISEQPVHLTPGSNRFTAAQPNLKKGFHTFWARVESATDTFKQNNELSGFTVVKDKPRVLMIAQSEAEGKELREALIASDVQVDARPPSFVPPRLSQMKRYDAMILVNVPSSAFALDQMKTIQNYVQNLGGGLLVIGGENSYSLGDYAKTPLGDVLPVTMNIPGKRDRGSVSLMLIIDKSGSMDMREEGVTKMQMAREAAQVSLDSLDATDRVAVLAFDTQSRWIVQPRQVGQGNQVDQIKDRIKTIEASGGTEIYPALEMGFRAIRETPARYKHIILLTDGRSLSSADYDRLIAQMRQESVTLSTIAIGSDSDTQLLEELAKQGEGRYYYVDKARDIPKVTTKEAKIASGSPIVEGQIAPKVLAPSPIIRSIAPASLPQLGGYVVTSIKDQAQTILAPDEVRADPLLAQWQYGLGRSIAWTSDIKLKWAAAWLTWGDFKKFWTQAVRWAMPAPSDPNLQVGVTVESPNVIVRVDAVDDEGSFRDGQDIRVSVLGQGFRADEQPMRQVAPGRYEYTATIEDQGVYSVDVSQYENGKAARTESTGFVVPYPAEYRYFGADDNYLGRLAAITGGKILRDPRAVFSSDGLKFQGLDWTPLWPYLLGAALILLPIDIAMRRLQVPTELVHRALVRWSALIPRRRREAV
ncbi:MAG TPA: VWA domain-containing protein [Chloroflexota bacterium]